MRPSARLPTVLLALLAVQALILGIAPRDRTVWAMENGMALVAIALVAVLVRRFGTGVLKPMHYAALYAFLAIHLVGAHFTYTHTPGPWELGRNHFDRLVHFSFGLLLAPAAAHLLQQWLDLRGAARSIVPWMFVVAAAGLFEVGEMTVAILAGSGSNGDYLGAQGDAFDAVWDIALAAIGSACTLAWIAWRGRDSAKTSRTTSP